MKFENAAGEQYWPSSWLTFNDVLLKPQRSPFKSRMDSHISLVSCLAEGVSLDIPFISANMDTVTGSKMAIEMSNLGGLGILHRIFQKSCLHLVPHLPHRISIGHFSSMHSGR
jgi:IMP dehydrogenase/GMP reductase